MTARPSWAVGSDTERLVDTEAARLALGALWLPNGPIGAIGGFRHTGGDPGRVTASTPTPDTEVHVAAFQAVLPSSRGDGPYVLTLDAAQSIDVLGVDPADPANPRRDLVVAQQSDAFYGDGNSLMTIRRITGTPSATPADPVVDGSPDYIPLARIRVPANATAITDGDIDDLRPAPLWTVAVGGILPVRLGDGPAAGIAGRYRHRLDTRDLEVDTGAAWLPATPRRLVTTAGAGSQTNITGETVVATLTANLVSGQIYRIWGICQASTGAVGDSFGFRVREDSISGQVVRGGVSYTETRVAGSAGYYIEREYDAMSTGSKTLLVTITPNSSNPINTFVSQSRYVLERVPMS